ncbi:hypothetical protein DRO02_07425 [archaeon]|nr:MAG: hypothetical protein DRO02_07425 [archaeon]
MEKVGVNQIKERVVDVIRELRGLTLLTKNDVHIERFIRKNGEYEITGVYECGGGLLSRGESGKFLIVLNRELELIKADITPTVEEL